MIRFSVKRSLMYAICLIVIYRIVYKVYLRKDPYLYRRFSFAPLQRNRKQLTEANIIIEPLQQHEEKNMAHLLINQSADDKNEIDKNLTGTTTGGHQLDLSNSNQTKPIVDLLLSSTNRTIGNLSSLLTN